MSQHEESRRMVIRMMGGLSLSRDGKTVATSDSRMKKVWTLIAYLVLHRNDPISWKN